MLVIWIVVVVFLIVIGVFGILGNFVVVFIIFINKRFCFMWYLFFVSLVVFDFVIVVLVVFFYVVSKLFEEFEFLMV